MAYGVSPYNFAPAPVGYDVIGAEQLMGRAGIWTKTHIKQEGHYLVATLYLVAAGNPQVLQMRVDLRPLEKLALKMHQKLHAEMCKRAEVSGEPIVGWSMKSMWRKAKNTAKVVAKNKIVRTVVKVHHKAYKITKKVVKNKYVTGTAVAVLTAFPPTTAIGVTAGAALLAANGAIAAVEKGQALVKGAMRTKRDLEDAGRAVGVLKTAKARGKAKAAAQAGTSKQARRRGMASRIAQLAALKRAAALKKVAQSRDPKRAATAQALMDRTVSRKTRQQLSRARSVAQAKARVTRAARIRERLKSPKVRAALKKVQAQAAAAKGALSRISSTAQYGTGQQKADAQKSAAIINLAAQNRARLRAIAEQNVGGLPGILIDRKGRLRRGKFRVVPKAPGQNAQVLYLGPNKNTQQGQFTAVSGVGASPWDIVGASPWDIVGCPGPECRC